MRFPAAGPPADDMNADEKQPIRYGLIGAGAFGRYCIAQYRTLPQVQPVALADADAQVAKEAANATGMEACPSVDELLARDDIDLVHLATPPWTHYPLAMQALRAGKHVLCEKPLALNITEAEQMIAAARQHNRLLAVNLIMRYNPLCDAVSQIIENRWLGEPLHGFFENYAKDEQLPPDHWFWDRQRSGGIFIEHGVHFFDLFASWLGEAEVVAAQQTARPVDEPTVPDAAGQITPNEPLIEEVQCTLRYAAGPLVNFYHGFTQAERMDRQEMRLVFERGSVRLFEWVPTRLEIDCLADDATLATMRDVLINTPANCNVDQLTRYEGDARRVTSRHKCYEVDGRFVLRANVGMNKAELYGHVLRNLLADQVRAIHDPAHPRRVSDANGLSSLRLAEAAQRLA